MLRIVVTSHRKCGTRKEGGVYAVTPDVSEDGRLALFTECHPPVPYQVKLHRGPRLVDAETVLDRQPMETWWMDSSAKTEEKKAGDAYFKEIFGMSLSKRLSVGECAGCRDASEALATLVSKIGMNPRDRRVGDLFRAMTRQRIEEIARVGAHYTVFHQRLSSYIADNQLDDLMGAQAALWRMAYAMPPRKWGEYIPFLVRFLALLGLSNDARAMRDIFIQ